MIKPQPGRVLIKPIFQAETISSESSVESQMVKAGEDLFVGNIIDPGQSNLKVGQLVYYSEYSSAMIFDLAQYVLGKQPLVAALEEKNIMVIVSADDIMAVDE